MDKSKTNAIVEGFWQYLKKENKLDLLPDVLHALSKKVDEMGSMVTVFSSTALSTSQKEEVGKIISSNFGNNKIDFEVDQNLIGGIKVKIGSEVLDLSVQNKLDYLIKSI